MTTFDENGDVSIDYDNVVKNIKKHKSLIANRLNIDNINNLNEFLVFYINALQEIEHQGEQDLYTDITLEELIEDIEGLYSGSEKEEWKSNPNFDIVTVKDIA